MATESLRKDHDLIEKVVKAMEVTLQMLKAGKKIPESILMPTLDFTKNFTDVCHHGKEEESFFPALGQAGFPTNMGPIAVMLMEHEITRKIAIQMETSAKQYLESGSSDALISDITQYVQHMSEHLWKENNKLFMMAEMRLSGVSDKMNADLDSVEKKKLEQLGKSRQDYESLVQNIQSEISKIN
ncbi:MAG: hemerythrin domain-containing protein [Candidatus Nitrosotenuis sp.]